MFKAILRTAVLASFFSATAHAQGGMDQNFCATLLQKFIPKSESRFLTPAEQLGIHSNKNHFFGTDTGRKYQPQWGGEIIHSRPQLRYEFKGKDGGYDPNVIIRLQQSEGLPHVVEASFPRSGEFGYEDANLIRYVFKDLFAKSTADDVYILEITDPTYVERFNNIFEGLLKNIKFIGDYPRRVSVAPDEDAPAVRRAETNPLSDSYFPSLTKDDAKDLMNALNKSFYEFENEQSSGSSLGEALTGDFLNSTLGRSIHKSGAWMIRVSLKELPRPPSLSEFEERPLIYRYQVEIRPQW